LQRQAPQAASRRLVLVPPALHRLTHFALAILHAYNGTEDALTPLKVARDDRVVSPVTEPRLGAAPIQETFGVGGVQIG
jgi:hypothetical protein